MEQPRLALYDEERDTDAASTRAVALLLAVSDALGLPATTHYYSLALLCDRSLPVVLADAAAAKAVPALAPLSLACLLVACKVHQPLQRISNLLAAADTVAPGIATRVSIAEVAAAELWLVASVSLACTAKLLSCRVASMLSELHSRGALQDVTWPCCCAVMDLLHEDPSSRGCLTAISPGLAAAVITTAAMLSVPPSKRAAAAPWLAWLACAAEEREDVQGAAEGILCICLFGVM
jgi:hypothetical protein